MTIIVNGTPTDVQATDIAALLSELGYADAPVATALNETFVPAGSRAATALAAGDRIEILAPRQGG
ncbi:MAG: sulfur carrier protein ThiS [Pseudomonadota bacterium]